MVNSVTDDFSVERIIKADFIKKNFSLKLTTRLQYKIDFILVCA